MFDYEALKFIWWGLIGFLFIGFAVTDGMDMGVGGLLPFVAKKDVESRVVINTVGAHWDGNQVWLITAGASLFAAWPLVYATAFSGFYFAMMLTLFSLFLRPLAFDYRSKIESEKWRTNWDKALFVGSMVPPLVFGVAFGNLLQGVPFGFDSLMRVTYTGSFFALFTPFTLLTGVVSVCMMLMHGSTWLVLRTDADVAQRSANIGRVVAVVLAITFALAGVMVWQSIDGYSVISNIDKMGQAQPTIKEVSTGSGVWLANFIQTPLLWLVPLLGIFMPLVVAMLLGIKNKSGSVKTASLLASALSIASIILTAGISMFPFVMPSSSQPNHSLLMWDTVSSEGTLGLMLMVVAVFTPIIIGYTFWCYKKMWRTVTIEEIEQNSHSAY
ncbi:cytochrome d ubiquinol oxidase subunit II [Psychrosphaera sp. B3R10]|uniref:cytochrome d ubiquinol oxidase subunit II n=1 Tax=unclassified Psychrosphaera TaxID=2641570 RepID=UPI001C09F26B|nr:MULTISPECIES: cytochrome d ubiquinol oxidase subunit II [unclassified Psychrosphaera]MBU2883582.1 cytochrome d ubiquinol oxidase subunit II [Psychrosphaera sp. I2R16]MBU2989760.1 cytochrome d ubiquinol oxidase subunit II [Psychrosphaera sp. B3R10]